MTDKVDKMLKHNVIIDLLKLQKQFMRCEMIKTNDLKTLLSDFSWEAQEYLLNLTVKNTLVSHCPVKRTYQKKFLRLIITYLESQSIEIHDGIYKAYCNYNLQSTFDDTLFFKHFILDINETNKKIITVKESSSFVSQGTTGLCSWQASLVLAEYCIDHSDLVRDKAILELGAGVGLLGLFISMSCKLKRYVFSDCHPAVLKLLSNNISINAKQLYMKYFDFPNYDINFDKSFEEVADMEYNFITCFRNDEGVELGVQDIPWEDAETCDIPECGLILAADVVYDSTLLSPLCKCLHHLLNRKKMKETRYKEICMALVACTIRNEETVIEFIREIESLDLKIVKRAHVTTSRLSTNVDPPVNIYEISN